MAFAKHTQDHQIDPPEKHVVPEGLEMFNQLYHETADELFIDEVADFIEDRKWWFAALKECLKPNPDECDLGKQLRRKIIDMATRAGNSQYAKDTYLDEMGAL